MLRYFGPKSELYRMKTATLSLVLMSLAVTPYALGDSYVEKSTFSSGAAMVMPFLGGEYVHGKDHGDGRAMVAPILTGAVPRESYVYFSAEEEAALAKFRDQELAKEVRQRVTLQRAKLVSKGFFLRWPRVVVRGAEICVPELVHSESVDWKDHLTCYQPTGKN